MNKTNELKDLIKEMYDYWSESDECGHHKHQEGHITIMQCFDNYFEEQQEYWLINVYSYIFCDGRRFEYKGITKEDVLQEAINYFKVKFKEFKECEVDEVKE